MKNWIRENSSEDLEKEFVNAFVNKDRQSRSLHELQSKKRREFFQKISRSDSILRADCLSAIPSSYASVDLEQQALITMLKTHGAGSEAYLMSYLEQFDRKLLDITEAVTIFVKCTMECILIGGKNLALVKMDIERANFLLRKA